jgi:hypothetical protein
MKYDHSALPLGTPERARAQLAKLDLRKALRTCRSGHIPLEAVRPELAQCLERLYAQQAFGVILSGYYDGGVFGKYTVDELLRKMFEKRDYPGFLKQAYRFDAYSQLSDAIDEAISWHFSRKLADAEAWRRKFAKLKEQQQLLAIPPGQTRPVEILDEGDVERTESPPNVLRLTPMRTLSAVPAKVAPEPSDDPYIISQTARTKLEKANALHRATLDTLRGFIEARRISISESRLIDAYALMGGQPAIFEVKSITEENERDQIRHAVSQLYEYRYLHGLPNASVWIVLSQEPASNWQVDYLTKDRGIHVLWVSGDGLAGASLTHLEKLCRGDRESTLGADF